MKKRIEIYLSKLKKIENPKYWLEQYSLTPNLAAEILNIAFLHGDIKNKKIVDLGCGNGILTIGAKKFGAKFCVGIDIDKDAIKTSIENSRKLKNVFFILADIDKVQFRKNFDTAIQNPPFGLKSERHYDIKFLKKAFEISKKVYSLHRNGYRKTINFINSFAAKNNFKTISSFKFKLDLPRTFHFHKSEKKKIEVRLYIFEKQE